VDRQRGHGVFERSIAALQKLNAVGYGTRLPLHLVYNPLGPTLPPPQEELAADYRDALRADFGIVFNELFALANQPIMRFADDLRASGRFEEYLELLAASYNPHTLEGVMCRDLLSVDYRGELYDCDFNQMLDLPLGGGLRRFLWDLDPADLADRPIATGSHCLACTAGCGSSCTGALAAASGA
jgi:radical SAM/Cys-rich protein